MKLVVLDGYALNPGDLSWAALRSIVEVVVHDRTAPDQIVARSLDADILLTNKTPLRAATLAQLPKLKFIAVLATGHDVVDSAAAKTRGIPVSNVPTYGTDSVAQFAFALILELCHRVQLHSDAVRAGEWTSNPDWSFWKTPLIELSGKTLGIAGFGRIGRRTAAIGHAMGMRILANDLVEANAPNFEGFRWAGLDELFAESDVISLHCPLTADNEGMVNAARLDQMKRNAFLVNTSRGKLIVAQDLADALNADRIAGAAIDVLPVEPPPAGNPLFTAKNCILTPHIAWATQGARERLMNIVAENVRGFLAGTPMNIVNR
jgi:glycerate dehydrogenase